MKLGKRLQIFLLSSLFLMWIIAILLVFLSISGLLTEALFLIATPLASGSFLFKGIELVRTRDYQHKIEEKENVSCQYSFGYLNQRDRTKPLPQECIECEKAVECMLGQSDYSTSAVAEIKKWY